MKQLGCLCGCKQRASARGLNTACAAKLQKRIDAGEMTWEQLEAEGKSLPLKVSRWRNAKVGR